MNYQLICIRLVTSLFFVNDIAFASDELMNITRKSKLFIDRQVTNQTKEFIRRRTANFVEDYDIKKIPDVIRKRDRKTGDIILNLAVIYWVKQDANTLSYLVQWCRNAIKIDQWGNNNDLEISHLIFALSVVYDWHGNRLDDLLQSDLKDFIYRHVRYQYEYAQKNTGHWWASSYWQNHCWINYTSILSAGLALWEDYPETAE